ncbi:metallophosphoesterase [Rheinheimera soli]|uniref:Serine/threonine protein phosphatase 1 n=1 Tax=Rheinheimera soli TaxID=443616 RepID=A0ABU1W5C7_9GAMM|nr:metallophosphoesterase [Rheinheimera soli]MDR7123159.1 serine/threonine protein phosphatase 1 [Rheinheimera soli]
MYNLCSLLSFEQNIRGRDFIVGDIHGHVELLFRLLSAVKFDYSNDRVFAVGDLIDRGPNSFDALQLTKEPWFFSCLGNHELFMLESGQPEFHDVQQWRRNGGDWFFSLCKSQQNELRRMITENMPVSISLQNRGNMFGIIHASIPSGMNWKDLYGGVLSRDLLYESVWDRRYWLKDGEHRAQGIHTLFCGHTPGESVRQIGNIINLDTGTATIKKETGKKIGRLTLCEISTEFTYSSCDYVSLDAAERPLIL